MYTISKIGFWSGIIATCATVAFIAVQLLQVANVLRFPTDEILIYSFSLCIVVPFVIEVLALYHTVQGNKKFWAHAALLFTVIYAMFVSANYIVQLATVIPQTLNGSAANIYILKQLPHSLFWDFDAAGYICMGLATLFAAPVFEKKGPEKWARFIFLVHGIVTTPVIALVYFYPVFSLRLLFIGGLWAITAPAAMLLLALKLRRDAATAIAK